VTALGLLLQPFTPVQGAKNGHLRIPQSYVVQVAPAGGTDDDGSVNLGVWVITQRRILKPFLDADDNGKIKEVAVGAADRITKEQRRHRIHQLNEIGFLWNMDDIK
jgi:hypothetical protein